MPVAVDFSRLGVVAAVYMVGAALLTNVVVGFVVVGAGLGVAAFVLWARNLHNLRALNAFLAHQARTGKATVDRLSDDGG